ncbi:iron-containing redox enzyme family protein [Burkholderia stagnalis]|uniref:Thiaminase-2/PQQC domain-containing protein n=1 Tax=Burkholderia stagnalis TaxID=1503054 RepID=A0ABX9YLT4_9BURK|nr:iron-containing redox enzyme family protein [Burkholderia stagnalis]KVM83977.1 hypothetical protein WT05_18380 [Burkholderia stagnalis]KVN27529.1 hypothetical protein WT11_27120 [Burkholderia stagnalis]MDY7806499.1 iron-containing redox enzyme family protein [Burkholderia stagnalis]RQQ58482.1 hypothetical protein DF158_17065 [Burkholderia stagnalis]RQQ70045.1 hypothetical protein DF139_14405 [Burkholderia stagnalis]
MGETTETGERPRLRHCTLVALAGERLAMIVGDERFELEQVQGTRDAFLRMKRYLDGRHTLEDIAQRSDVSYGSVRTIVGQLGELGLLRRERPAATIAVADFLERVDRSTRMWRAQIGYHRLFGMLERGEASRDLIAGLLLETYHFVRLAPRHVGAAIAHCREQATAELLCGYLADEYAHHGLIAASVEKLGIPREQIRDAHPVIGTLSLVNMLCEVGRASSLGYLCCLKLIEASPDEEAGARGAWREIARTAGLDADVFDGLMRHMRIDVGAGHAGLLEQALARTQHVPADAAHVAINHMHDVKHAFDQFHDQVIQYYTDMSNYVPRLKVDFFSL